MNCPESDMHPQPPAVPVEDKPPVRLESLPADPSTPPGPAASTTDGPLPALASGPLLAATF